MAEGNSSKHPLGTSEEDNEYFKSNPRQVVEDESDNEETGHQPLQTSNVSPPRNETTAESKQETSTARPSGTFAQIPVQRSNTLVQHFGEYVDITFFLYCESKKKVDLIIQDVKTTEILMRSCGGGIYSASAKLSLSRCQNGEITYRYKRCSLPTFVSQIFTGSTQVEIEDCDHDLKQFIKGIPVRDYWEVFNVSDEIPKVGFKAHCLHIFSEMFNTNIIPEETRDLNQTIRKFIASSQQDHPLPDSEINSLVSSVLSMSLASHHYIGILALLSSIGFQHVEKILNKKQSQIIIDNVRESGQHVTSMFAPYREKMPQLLYNICQLHHGKDMSVLKLIEKVYPFLDAKEFLSFHEPICPFYGRHSMEVTEVSDIIKIFTADREFTLDCKRLIEVIIKQLNFNELQELSKSLPEVKVIQDNFRTRCEIKVSKVKDLQELYEFCQSIDKCCCEIVQEEVQKKLQEGMRNVEFSHTTINKLTILKFFCHTFFRNLSPNPIVEQLVLYPDNKGHLLKLLDHFMFAEKQEYCREAVERWIEKRLVALKENIDMIDQIYSWLETISKLPAFKKEGCASLEDKVFKVVENFTFWEVFSVALQQEARSKMFEKHVSKVLETQKPTRIRMEDLHVNVKKFDGRAQDLDRFDGRLLVCLLDLMRPHLPTDGMQVVLAIMDDATFWRSVVQSKGKGMDLVKKHRVYEIVTSSFEALMDCLETNKFDYKFALTMNESTNRDHLVQLMKHLTSCDTATMMSHITQACDRMFTTRNSLKDTSEMLQNLERMLPEDHSEYFSDTLTELMTSLKQQLSTKQNLVTYYDSGFLYTYKAMKENYDLVKGALTSEFFWKVNKNQRDKLPRLVMQVNSLTAVERYLQTLAKDFLTKYKHNWEDLQKCSSLQIKDMKGLFSGRNIDQEMEIMSKHSICLYDATRKTIFRNFFKFQEYNNKIKLLASTAEVVVFVYPTFLSVNRCISVMKVRKKVQTMIDSGNGVLWDMGTDLQIIEEFASKVTDDMQEVLMLIQESTELLQFLKNIQGDDISILSDSLEEYSEEIVRKSTVVSLREVEKVFGVLKTKDWEHTTQVEMFLLEMLQKQNLKHLARQLDECIDNTHGLKDLLKKHSSISSRIEDMINNILTNGNINFEFIHTKYAMFVEIVNCNGRYFCLNESDLADLQSRAKLICNTVDKNTNVTEQLRDFVEIINTGLKVLEVLKELVKLGHYQYRNYQNQNTCSGNGVKGLLDKLNTDCESWKESVKNIRKRYTCLNYVHSSQLTALYEYFVEGQRNQNAKSILQFVNPTYSTLPNETKVADLNSDTKVLEHIAEHLQEIERCEPTKGVQLHQPRTRQFLSSNQRRQKNVIVTKLYENSKDSFNVMFGLYMEKSRVFPRADQVIICTPETTWQDVELMLRRLCQSKAEELYCIVNGDLLCDNTLRQLSEEIKKLSVRNKTTLAIILRGDKSIEFLDRHNYAIQQVAPIAIPEMKECIRHTWPSVYLVTSKLSGLGKTEYIRQKNRMDPAESNIVRLHISSIFNATSIIKRLQKLRISEKTLLHIDIGMIDAPEELDKFLFELIVFRYVRSGYHSAYLFTRHIAIEVANTINNTLIDKLMLLSNFNTIDLRWEGFDNFVVSQEVNSPIQLVCHSLNDDPDKSDQRAKKPLSQERCRKILSKTFENDIGMSYTKLKVFLAVFAAQLRNMTTSEFFQSRHIKEDYGTDSNKVPQVRSSMVKLMLEISIESCQFAECLKSSQSMEHVNYNTGLVKKNSKNGSDEDVRKKDSDEDEDNEYDEGSLKDIIRWEDINHIIVAFHQNNTTWSLLYKKLKREPDYVTVIKEFLELYVQSNAKPLMDFEQKELKDILRGIACSQEMSEEKYEEALKNYVLTPDNVLKFVLILLRLRAGIPVVLLGDTGCGKTSLINVLAEICGVQFEVLHIHAGVTEEEILEKILDFNSSAKEKFCEVFWLFIDEVNTNEHVGLLSDVLCHHVCFENILAPNLSIIAACNPYRYHPVKKRRINIGLRRSFSKSNRMSHLVYHVHPLPESLLSLVTVFETLGKQDEEKYIKEMLKKCKHLNADELTLFTDSVLKSQQFVRKSEHTEYSVSLRDVERCRYLLEWFVETYFVKKYGSEGSKNKEAIVLTLNLCYGIRFQSHKIRKEYIKEMESIKNSTMNFEFIIDAEQEDIIKRMQLPPGIAVTNSLSENIFAMIVCALTRIPLFVVGKPGCSKTLSVQLLRSNLRGDDSRDKFFRELPCVFSVTYLGTKSSTSESIEKAFQKTLQYQKQHNVAALLILDEIGQAERSDYNPLKVLHTLLEGSGVHADVAVIGISNWQLDAAKMNRAIHLARPDMEEKELALVATSIYRSTTSHVTKNMSTKPPEWIEKLAKAFTDYTKKQTRSDFHGLRDFYHLIRYISERVGRRLLQSDLKVIASGVLRNFSGLLPMDSRAFAYFKRGLALDVKENEDLVLERIRANIGDKNSRHLMLISHGDASIATILSLLQELNRDYVQLFGSTLPNDQSKEYEHRILSKLVLCMENGEVVVLKNLPNIYGNLYDMLNQSYCVVGGKRHCRVALSADYFPMCCVHEDFKCITVVDRDDIRNTEIPFLNRFEKQQMSLEELLSDTNKKALGILEKHLGMSLEFEKDEKLDDRKLMPIQGKESLSSLVSYSTDKCPVYNDNPYAIWQMCMNDYLPEVFYPEIVTTLTQSKVWKTEQHLVEKIQKTYWKKPVHKGLKHFLEENKIYDKSLYLVFTHSTVNAQLKDVLPVENTIIVNLYSVASERKLRSIVQNFEEGVLVIQLPSEVPAENITFVKTMVEKEKYRENGNGDGQIVLLVHLDRCGDQKLIDRIEFSKKWEIVTLDSLLEPFRPLPDIVGKSALEVLENMESYFLTRETLYWAFTRIHYVDDDEESEGFIKRIETILNGLEDVRKHLWNCIITWLQSVEKEQSKSDIWLLELARKTFVKENVGSFIGVIEKYLVESVHNPLAVLIYQLEKNHALQYLVNDDKYLIYVDKNNENTRRSKKEVWGALLDKENLLLENTYIKPSGPGCYKIHHKNIEYKVPFGKCIIEKVERFKEEFLAGLEYDYSDAKQCMIHQSELVTKLHKEICEFEQFLQYEGFEEEYLDDFKTYISSIKLSSLQDKTKINVPLWVKSMFTLDEPRDTLETIVSLHTTFWMHSLTINELLKLLHLTQSVELEDVERIIEYANEPYEFENIDEKYPKLYRVTKLLCEKIFPSSIKGRILDRDFISWQQTAYALRSVSEQLSSEPPCFATLKFFLELATAVDEGGDFTFSSLVELGDKISCGEHVLDIDHGLVEEELIKIVKKISDKDRSDFIRSCYFSKYLVLNDDPATVAGVLRKIKPSLPGCKYLGSPLRHLFTLGNQRNDLETTASTTEISSFHLLDELGFSDLLIPYNDVSSLQKCIEKNHILGPLQNMFCDCCKTDDLALILGDILERFIVKHVEFPSRKDLSVVRAMATNLLMFQGNDANKYTLPILIFSAFLKRFVSLFVDLMNDRRTIDKAVIECVNGILKHGGQLSEEGMLDMQMYFLQQLEAGNGLLILEAKCMESRFKDLEVCKTFELETETRECLLDITVERLCGHERYKSCQIMISNTYNNDCNSQGIKGEFDSLGVLAYSLSNVYLRQYLLGDADRESAKFLSELPMKLHLTKDEFYLQILKVLTLQDDSRLHIYHLSKESPSCDVYLAAFAVFFLSILSENQDGIWMKMVKDPHNLCQNQAALVRAENSKKVLFSNCHCGQRFIDQYDDGSPAKCPQGHLLSEGDSIQDNIPCYQTKFSDKILQLLTGSERLLGVSPLSQQILRLLVSVCLACGLEKVTEQLADILNVHENKVGEILEKQLKENWKFISHCLSVGHCELYHILTIFVDEYREDIFNWKKEDSWILTFQDGIHSVIRDKRFCTSETALLISNKQRTISEREASKIRLLMDEDCTTKRTRIPYLRKTSNPSIDSLTTELWLSGEKEHFPFLRLVLEKHNDFGMLRFMATLIKWHLSTVNLFSYKLKRSDCHLPFDKLQRKQSHMNRIEKELKPNEFRNEWNELVKYCRKTMNLNIGLKNLSRGSTVEEHLNLDPKSQIQKAIDTMVSIQNRFLDEAMSICAEKTSCKSLGLLRYGERKAAVPISPLVKVTSDMIIDFDLSDNDLSDNYLRFSQNDTSVGRGRHVEYNYLRIEFELAQNILTGKTHLRHTHQSLPKIQFRDDVFKNTMDLIEQIKVSVKQELIPTEISDRIRVNIVDRQELLNLSEVLLAHINHAGPTKEAASSLQQYMTKRKNVFGENDYDSLIPDKGFMKLQLCHVVALYRLMEELNGELVLEDKQGLYGDDLTTYSSDQMYKIDREFLTLFLSAMRTFAFRCLQNDEDVDKSIILRDESCLGNPVFWPDNSLQGEKVHVYGKTEDSDKILDSDFYIRHIWSIHQHVMEILKNPGSKATQQRKTPLKNQRSQNAPTGSGGKRNNKKPSV